MVPLLEKYETTRRGFIDGRLFDSAKLECPEVEDDANAKEKPESSTGDKCARFLEKELASVGGKIGECEDNVNALLKEVREK